MKDKIQKSEMKSAKDVSLTNYYLTDGTPGTNGMHNISCTYSTASTLNFRIIRRTTSGATTLVTYSINGQNGVRVTLNRDAAGQLYFTVDDNIPISSVSGLNQAAKPISGTASKFDVKIGANIGGQGVTGIIGVNDARDASVGGDGAGVHGPLGQQIYLFYDNLNVLFYFDGNTQTQIPDQYRLFTQWTVPYWGRTFQRSVTIPPPSLTKPKPKRKPALRPGQKPKP